MLLLRQGGVLTQILAGLTILEELLSSSLNKSWYISDILVPKIIIFKDIYPFLITRKFFFTTVIHLDFFQVANKFRSFLLPNSLFNWVKVFNNGSSKICQPLKNLNCYGCLSTRYHFTFFKGCLPQIFYLVPSWLPFLICYPRVVYNHVFLFF